MITIVHNQKNKLGCVPDPDGKKKSFLKFFVPQCFCKFFSGDFISIQMINQVEKKESGFFTSYYRYTVL
jgi:hypothetical protein